MASRRSFARVCGSAAALVLGAALAMAGGCESDNGNTPGESAAGQNSAGAGGQNENGAGAPNSGGSDVAQGGVEQTSGGVGGEAMAGSATAGAGSGGAPAEENGDCLVKLSMNTSNAADAATPLSEKCAATTYEGQINFDVSNGVYPDFRDLAVDFFESPVAGASVKIEDGYDFASGKGAVASYLDASGVWNADKGSVSIESVTNDVFVVKLTNVHFVVLDGPGTETGSGEFVANGTITGPSMGGI